MADFNIAYEKTAQIEGGYSNHPDDPGGETICGISRRYYPYWGGWQFVDAVDDKKSLLKHRGFIYKVSTFYKTIFWDYFSLDAVDDQTLANEIYDSAVNLGHSRVTKWIQTALNILNRKQKKWFDIAMDGAFGPTTRKTLLVAMDEGEGRYILKLLNAYQGTYYSEVCLKNEKKESFIHGWLNHRVTV